MKRSLRLLSALLAFCVLAAMVSPVGLASGRTVHTISSETDLDDFLNSEVVKDGDVIQCQEDVTVEQASSGADDPWIINKRVTIDGGDHMITVRRGGILLGADVTLQNAKLSFTSSTRNAIIANGYSLTLDDVRAVANQYSFNVFCGTLTKNDFETTFTVPSSGNANSLTISGNTNLQGSGLVVGDGNIYAGSLSMGAMAPDADYDGPATTFSGDVSIQIENSGGGNALGTIYASGAQQRNPSGVQGQKITAPDPDKYTVSGAVTITGTNALPTVDGAGAAMTNVVYKGNGYQDFKVLRDISSLSVESGELALTSTSRLNGSKSLSVAQNAKLNLAPMTGVSNLDVQSFNGNGYLILGVNQTWELAGTVAGNTSVAIGSMGASGDGWVSGSIPKAGHTYIQAPQSQDSNFILLPPASNSDITLEKDDSGNWTATGGTSGGDEGDSKLISLTPPAEFHFSANSDEDAEKGAIIPLYPQYTGEPFLDTIKLTICVNGENANAVVDENFGYCYEARNIHLYVADYGENGEELTVYSADPIFDTPPNGTYLIQITVPGEYTESGADVTGTCTLTVGDNAPATLTEISVNSTAHKTEYKVGDPLDVTDLTIMAVYTDGSRQQVRVTPDMVSGFDSTSAVESQTLTITYRDRTTTYTVRIAAPEEPGKPQYQVTLTNLGDGGSGEGLYAKGSTVTIRAGSKSGYTFSSWQQSEGVTLVDQNSPETSFTMPGKAVTLQAVWTQNGGTQPSHTHVWSSAWGFNGAYHWHDCTASGCTITVNSEKDGYAAHTAGDWVVDQPAAAFQSGSRHRSCTVCGYEMERETIPATGGGGSSSDGDSSTGGGGSSSGGGSSTGGGGSSSGGGPSTGGGGPSSGSGSSSGSSSNNTSTVKNPDGSTTTASTDKVTGTVTETTQRPDGSKTVVETKKDGVVTTTNTEKDGSTVKTVVRPDGASETTVQQANGLTASVREDGNSARADVRLPSEVVQNSQSGGGAVTLPIPALPGTNASVTVRTGSTRPVRVEIPVRGDENTTVACLVNSDGSETILKTAVLAGGQITVSIPDGATVHIRDNGKDFQDTVGHWAEDAIEIVSARELFSGEGPQTFAPEDSMSRAMLMTVLARLDGADAAGGSAYEDGLAWAMAQGISDGRDPDGQVTREQFVVMLHRYAGSPAATERELRFSDSEKVSGYAREAVRWAVENGILSGYEDGSFLPGGETSRAQAAAMLARYVKLLNQQ